MYTKPEGSGQSQNDSGIFSASVETVDDGTNCWSEWSEWQWNLQLGCWRRYRSSHRNHASLGDAVKWQWESSTDPYPPATSSTLSSATNITDNVPRFKCTWPMCSQIFRSLSERDRHYKTVHSNNGERPYKCEVLDCPADVKSWTTAAKLKSHRKAWHGPYNCDRDGCCRCFPNGFGSQADLDKHKILDHIGKSTFKPPNFTPHSEAETSIASTKGNMLSEGGPDFPPMWSVKSKAPSQNPSKDHILDLKDFKVHRQNEFKFGRIFKVLWTEPKGEEGGTQLTMRQGHGTADSFQKIRRFIIIDARPGHCLCLPIMTYSGQGTAKRGVHVDDHAIIHTGLPKLVKGEAPLMRKPVKVMPISPQHKLDSASRLNYAKLYTVEYNVKVFFIGRVHKDSEWNLTADFKATHPPLPDRGQPPAASDIYGPSSSSTIGLQYGAETSKPSDHQDLSLNPGYESNSRFPWLGVEPDFQGSVYRSSFSPQNGYQVQYQESPRYTSRQHLELPQYTTHQHQAEQSQTNADYEDEDLYDP